MAKRTGSVAETKTPRGLPKTIFNTTEATRNGPRTSTGNTAILLSVTGPDKWSFTSLILRGYKRFKNKLSSLPWNLMVVKQLSKLHKSICTKMFQWTGLLSVIEMMPWKWSSTNTKMVFSSDWTTGQIKVLSIAQRENSMKETKWWLGHVAKVEINGSW